MVKPLSMDMREQAMARVAAGEPIRVVAAALGVGASSVSKWSTRLKATGTVAPGKMGGHVPLKLAGAHAQWLRERMAGADFTLRGLKAELAERNVNVDYRTVWKFVHREKLTFKKSVLPAEQDRPDVARKRARWKAQQGSVHIGRLVFIDETWAKTNMAPLRGWSLRGQRLKAKVPFGHCGTNQLVCPMKTMTFIAALRNDRIDAPWVVNGPVNAEVFLHYIKTQLVPTLGKGDIVIMDNLSSHKSPAIRAAIRAAGARLLFLPAYSPDLNPIEQVFAKLKHLLRKACQRTVEATWKKIGEILGDFTDQECRNYLINSGYISL